MISVSSPILSHLASSNRVAQIGLGRAQARLASSGDSLESTRQSGDSGQFSYATRLSGKTRASQNHMQNLQNSTTYVQMQQAGLEKARQVLERISVLASQAADPFLNNSQRASMNDEMDGLKSELENLRTTDFNGKYLFDDLASLTAKNFSFNDDLKEEVGVTEYSASEDVMYKSGRVILDVNTGIWMERFEVMQGSNKLFDSGYWATNGNAYSDDFDRFIIEFSPGKETTLEFQQLDTGQGGGNKNSPSTGEPNNPSSWQSDGTFNNQGFVNATLPGVGTENREIGAAQLSGVVLGNSDGKSSLITVKITSPSDNNLFQARAYYEQTGPTNYQTVGQKGSNDAVKLNPVGFGTLTDLGVATRSDAQKTLSSVLSEIENIGFQLGTIGSNLTLIEEAYNLAGDRVAAGQVSLLRMSENDYTDSSMEVAMKKIRADGNIALLTQAKEMSNKIYDLLW